jgi:hypothetical protein
MVEDPKVEDLAEFAIRAMRAARQRVHAEPGRDRQHAARLLAHELTAPTLVSAAAPDAQVDALLTIIYALVYSELLTS